MSGKDFKKPNDTDSKKPPLPVSKRIARESSEDAAISAEMLESNRTWATRLYLKARTDGYWLSQRSRGRRITGRDRTAARAVLPYAYHRESRDIAAAAKNEPKFAFPFRPAKRAARQ